MIYDITPPITSCLQVWPGDTPPTREVLLDMQRGDNITLSTLRATVHLGAHADAPSHYARTAAAIHERSLTYYLGPAQVVRVAAARATRVTAEMVARPLRALRVLIATSTFPDPEHFNTDFAALSPALVECLYEQGVKLIGIDTPSVDLFDSKDLPSHQMFLKHDMAILEGLALQDVPEGVYELIALPLRLVGFDASPVRAILRTIGEPGSFLGEQQATS
jgi:arylformamidase